MARLTGTMDYELPLLGGLFAGPLGVLPDLDCVLHHKHREHNHKHKERMSRMLSSLGLSQTESESGNED